MAFEFKEIPQEKIDTKMGTAEIDARIKYIDGLVARIEKVNDRIAAMTGTVSEENMDIINKAMDERDRLFQRKLQIERGSNLE